MKGGIDMNANEYTAREVERGVFHVVDYRKDSMYLIVGKEKALLFDTGMGEGDLRGFVEGLAGGKTVEVVISHAHWDHITQANQFEKVYMNHREREIAELFGLSVDCSRFLDVREGDAFDLGDRRLEVLEVPGHTPGSIVLLDREQKLLFSGDALGAGHAWLHLPGCLPLWVYLQSLRRLAGMADLFEKIYHGHLNESAAFGLNYLMDLIEAVEGVLGGSLKGEEYWIGSFPGLYVTVRSATLVYNPENLWGCAK